MWYFYLNVGTPMLYLVSSVFFIWSMRGLSSPTTARAGNMYGIIGMLLAIVVTLTQPVVQSYALNIAGIVIGGAIGVYVAKRMVMTALPQLIALYNSFVGLGAVFIAAGAYYEPEAFGIGTYGNIYTSSLIEMSLGLAIGAITFTGSVIAFAKLQAIMSSKPIVFPGQHPLNALLGLAMVGSIVWFTIDQPQLAFWAITAIAFILGVLMIIPIGGADMPVVISMLNSYSGWAACGVGFTLDNSMLIITGTLVGASGAILSYIMCAAMNRSFFSVILGGFGGETAGPVGTDGDRTVKAGSAEDAAFIMSNAGSVIIVPGYGMAVAQAQHALRDMADLLKENGVNVRYAIHPVAGRMPGHMNVLLAEASVPYDEVEELEAINRDFGTTDVAFVIGANDVTNPAAKSDPNSPIYGMPVLDVESAKTVLFVKRSMATGYAGVQNDLFFNENTMMLFGDAKKMCEEIVSAL